MKRTITFYNSFEEQEIAEAKYAASLTQLECLQQGVFLIKKIYTNQVDKKSDKRINFIKIV